MDWQIPSGFDVLHGRQPNLLADVKGGRDVESYEEYVQRMRKVRPFQFFGIRPMWHPGEKDIEGFCHDEVVRQFHDTRVRQDGGRRVEYLLDAWRYAQGEERRVPTVDDARHLGALIEPDENSKGYRLQDVFIGQRTGMFVPYITRSMDLLFSRAGDVVPGRSTLDLSTLHVEEFGTQVRELINTVDDFYLAFEWIHPFADGNGRTGKVLHNWLNGTLDDPVLVRDYFGGGNP